MDEVFISYKSERRRAAAHLAKILQRYGYTVWYDYSLVKGRDFAAQIDAKIRGAKALIVLWCSMSVRSEWVADEAALAAKLGILVPAKIEPCDLRVDFDRKDYVDLTGWGGAPRDHALDLLLVALKQRVGRAPELNFEAMREYEEDWRRFGAPSLKTFALEAPVEAKEEPLSFARPPLPQPHAVSPAERDWERFGIAESEDVDTLEAYMKQYGNSERLWAVKAKQRLAAVEVLLRERAKAEAERRRAHYRGDGRVEIDAAQVTNSQGRWFLPGKGKTEGFKDAEFAPEMVVAPAGSFMMGSPEKEEGHQSSEAPQHKVTIAKPFAVGRYAVTRGEFSAFVNETGYSVPDEALTYENGKWETRKGRSFRNPGFSQDDSHPVVCVNWDDAKAYAEWLSGKTGKDYRLLSEAEWEYVCRAGTTTPFWWGSPISTEQANYNGNYTYGGGEKGEFRQKTVPVKSFQPNHWGLYQVHGNVWEWCEDCWNGNYNGAPEDGSAWTTGDCSLHVVRGGSWVYNARNLRAANRYRSGHRKYGTGFRLARTL